jgi:transcriptional regulator of acetoin/glycerol metabolism
MTTLSYETDRRTVLDAASALFDSIGEVLLCVDGDMRIVYAPDDLRDLAGFPLAAALGAEVDALLRLGHRAETRAVMHTARGDRGVFVRLAPHVAHRDQLTDVKYVLVLHPLDEPDNERSRIIAALESSRWRRDAAARSLGISRATLWRKMREYGLL